MRKPLLLGEGDLAKLEDRAKMCQSHDAEVRVVLGGRFRADVAEFYSDSPGRVTDFLAEIRRLRGELQHSLRNTVAHVDTEGEGRHGDVSAVGTGRVK